MKVTKFMVGGVSPFDESFNRIKDVQARARILTRLRRLQLGNRGDFKHIENDLYELRIDVGKGWRVYYQQQGSDLVLLYLTGNKATQSKDIAKIKGLIHENNRF